LSLRRDSLISIKSRSRLLPDDDLTGIVCRGEQFFVVRVADGDHGGRVTEQFVDAWPGIAFHVEKKQRAILKKNKKQVESIRTETSVSSYLRYKIKLLKVGV
jgi:hypothetical protein